MGDQQHLCVKMGEDLDLELQCALGDLKVFVEQNACLPFATLHQFNIKEGRLVASERSPLAKVIDLTRCFFGATFSSYIRQLQIQKQDQVRHALLKAVDIVKSYYPLIEKLKDGNEDQQRLAEGALHLIERYNQVISQKKDKQPTWTGRFAEYIYKQSRLGVDEELKQQVIVLPQRVTYASDSVLQKENRLKAKKIQYTSESIQPSQQEVDAFRVKAITMIQKYQIPTPIQEAVSSLQEAPIEVEDSVEEGKIFEKNLSTQASAAIISLRQVLNPFPGEVIKLTGAFTRNPQITLLSTPIPESFRVSSRSTQTGFPHPLQHNGWALADALIPDYPLRPDQLPLFGELAKKKRELAYTLLPKGCLRARAKQFLEWKKEAYESDLSEFIHLHKTLAHSILEASASDICENIAIVDGFYLALEKRKDSYEYLAGVFHHLENLLITRLFDRLQYEWLEICNPDLRVQDGSLKYKNVQKILELQIKESLESLRIMEDGPYLGLMGMIFGKAALSMIMQSLSEKIRFSPPMLSDFEQKVQICALRQVMQFIHEFELPADFVQAKICLLMKNTLEQEISLFRTENSNLLTDKAAEISNELEVYFNSRYYTLLH